MLVAEAGSPPRPAPHSSVPARPRPGGQHRWPHGAVLGGLSELPGWAGLRWKQQAWGSGATSSMSPAVPAPSAPDTASPEREAFGDKPPVAGALPSRARILWQRAARCPGHTPIKHSSLVITPLSLRRRLLPGIPGLGCGGKPLALDAAASPQHRWPAPPTGLNLGRGHTWLPGKLDFGVFSQLATGSA